MWRGSDENNLKDRVLHFLDDEYPGFSFTVEEIIDHEEKEYNSIYDSARVHGEAHVSTTCYIWKKKIQTSVGLSELYTEIAKNIIKESDPRDSFLGLRKILDLLMSSNDNPKEVNIGPVYYGGRFTIDTTAKSHQAIGSTDLCDQAIRATENWAYKNVQGWRPNLQQPPRKHGIIFDFNTHSLPVGCKTVGKLFKKLEKKKSWNIFPRNVRKLTGDDILKRVSQSSCLSWVHRHCSGCFKIPF